MRFFLSVLLLMTISLPSYAGLEFLSPARIYNSIKKQVAKAELGASASVVEAEVIEGISAALKYRLASEPSYVDGYYTRIDKYTLDTDINVGDLIENNDTPFGFSVRKKAAFVFARQFKKQSESVMAVPYTFVNLPLTAQRALNRTNVGDFFAFETETAFVVSLGTSATEFLSGVHASASTHALIMGQFFVQLFKVSDSKVRIKFIANQSRGTGVGLNVGASTGLKVIGFSYLDKKLDKFIELTPVDIGIGNTKSNVFMMDYVFDLTNPQAAQAYDDLMQKKVQFKDIQISNPLIDREKIKQILLTDLSSIEEIYTEDHNLPAPQRRIDRLFKGSNSSSTTSGNFKFGFNLFRIEKGTAFASSKILSYDRVEAQRRYVIDTHSQYDKSKILFGLFGDETLASTNLLFLTDAQWIPQQFVAISMSHKVKMRSVSAGDFKALQRKVKEVLPDSEYNKIDWSKWTFKDGKMVNGYFNQELFILPQALQQIPKMSTEALTQRFKDFLRKSGRPSVHPYHQNMHEEQFYQRANWMDSFEMDIQYIAIYLQQVLSPATTSAERYDRLTKLRQYPIWKELGNGFLLSLLPQERISQLISYDLTLTAQNAPGISYRFGNFAEKELHDTLIYIQSIINNRSFDLRLWTDADGNYRTNDEHSLLGRNK